MSGSASIDPERLVETAVQAARQGGEALAGTLEALPVAAYATDAEGRILAYNRAAAALAGCEPPASETRWCVTYRLYDAQGAYLPPEACPMAVAIRERRRLRGVSAIAERPDGSRVALAPHPTPWFDDEERLGGAVNLLIARDDPRYHAFLRSEATRCRRLADSVGDARTVGILLAMARDYEARVRCASPAP
ncbi:PAS domain-containing protein [Sphingomonas naasensis]|uniref:PAS domain-containing protein n=1 Tax=Sphingomonas naasensis TaxID=1344951 RepID=A0A4S1WGZ0_9SPHN|nr:hypothetical protein [Sphingomonas naasensis]NIJ21760.1 PAS domain-containing protein [Sphingomonas naasensis]TGX40840.1 hypothetical protein E5A74_15295 [Sphingomonas naasensis]